jgi:hypothetical protein
MSFVQISGEIYSQVVIEVAPKGVGTRSLQNVHSEVDSRVP